MLFRPMLARKSVGSRLTRSGGGAVACVRARSVRTRWNYVHLPQPVISSLSLACSVMGDCSGLYNLKSFNVVSSGILQK